MKIISKPLTIKPDEGNVVMTTSVNVKISLSREEFDMFYCDSMDDDFTREFMNKFLSSARVAFNSQSGEKYFIKNEDFS